MMMMMNVPDERVDLRTACIRSGHATAPALSGGFARDAMKAVLNGRFFLIIEIKSFCFVVPSTRCGDITRPMLSNNSIWKSFLKYE